MPTWQNFKELTDLITIVAVNRNGAGQIKVDFDYAFVQIPEIQISATQIRNRVKANKPVAYLVADSVEKFITNSELYK
jgi:nicotinate-nucleotide adenylyltransferase